MNLAHLLDRAGRVAANHWAVIVGSEPLWTYRAFAERVSRLATGLISQAGLQPGDRVAIVMANRADYLLAMFASWHAGLVLVPVNAKLHGKEIAYILENCGVACLIGCPATEDQVKEAVALSGIKPTVLNVRDQLWSDLSEQEPSPIYSVSSDSPAWIFYTSGTTGRPKGATLTHRNLLTMGLTYFADVDTVSSDDHKLYVAPMSHGAGLYAIPYVLGMAHHLIPESGKFDVKEICQLISNHPKICFFAAPTMLHRLVASPFVKDASTANVKTIVYGGGPMYVEESIKAIECFGPKLIQIYGQGECPMTISVLPRAQHVDAANRRYRERLASVGYAQSSVHIIVADEEGNPLPTGEVGEILVSGDTVMSGYWGMPEATSKAFKNGFLKTGDLGSLDTDGFLTLKDRSKDLIISGGSNVYPREVEEVLLMHEQVDEVSVIGVQDRDWGERVVACVKVKASSKPDASELDTFCRGHIAVFKCPKDYYFVDELPKNAYGKVLKTTLRKMLG